MALFDGDTDPGADAFHACPECGKDKIYSKSKGMFKRKDYICDHCGYEAEKKEVKKSFNEIFNEKKNERMEDRKSEHSDKFVQSLVEGAEGPGVTQRRLRIDGGVVLDALDEGEQPHCIIKGAGYRGIEVETGDEIQRSGTKGAGVLDTLNNKVTVPNLTIPTDQRLLAIHSLRSGVDEYSIPYDSIDSVSIDRGVMKRRIQVTTAGRTYYFEVAGNEHEKAKDVVDFIRRKRQESVSGGKPTQKEDPMDKLERLSQLHEKGALTDEEFEEKKTKLLDEI